MVCSVEGCSNPVYVVSRGLCSKHYNRLRTTGTTDDGPQARGSLIDRFWKYVDVGQEDECWEWTAKSKVAGYGVIGIGGRRGNKILAHRLSYKIHYGEIPDIDEYHGHVIMHTCDNRLCVNPKHLVLARQADNVKGMDQKGRRVNKQFCGSAHKRSKLTESVVREIRESTISNAEWARRLGVTRQAVLYARVKGWRHV
jgi:hypothetical protein